MIRTLISMPYEIARLPLVAVDHSLTSRLAETSVARMTLDRAIGSADKLAGTLIGDREIAKRGSDRLQHAEKVRTAARLEQEADTKREQARETAVSGLQEADVAEARGKQQAKAAAARTAATKRAAADERAEKREEVAERRKERVEAAATAKKRTAQQRAGAELDDARETREAAAEERADAERLDDLVDAAKDARKQD
ncbi:hypothetical protein [Nocardioides halotolerans]|uniref:hypothetical protein n=1 Tax=Nocardioides halotolerans TaxID=433660 RepID=UPI0003FD105D|nr:hypothetical protein [Nocardioides halotolerans]